MDKQQPYQISLRLDADLKEPLEEAAARARLKVNRFINRTIREALFTESKLTNIIGSLSRIRGHQANTERLINLNLKVHEEFIKYFMRVTPALTPDGQGEREERMVARYRGFVKRLLEEDLADGGQAEFIRAILESVKEPEEPII